MDILKIKNIKLIRSDYKLRKNEIKNKLEDFKNVKLKDYFYELCFCLCTPQTKAESALKVQIELQNKNFKNRNFNPLKILAKKGNYIRFHKTKSQNLIAIKGQISEICRNVLSELSAMEKRDWLVRNILGLGLKEATHFLRNIGKNEELAILDRHILKQLYFHGAIDEIPKTLTRKKYLEIEKIFLEFSKKVKITINELDLLFWARATQKIIK